jgi:transposase
MKKRTYGSADVEKIDLPAIICMLTVGCIVAVDVAKTKFVAAIANVAGEVLRIVRFSHPQQTLAFLHVVEALHEAKLAPRVVMEPTGTYGDALRYQCHARGVSVEMMCPKHTHDIAEVLDGVPSMHDPKAAVALARLAVIRPARIWKPDTDERREMRALLDRRCPMAKTHDLYHGHLEAMLARHWPELGSLINVREQRSWMTLLQQYPGPHLVAGASEAAMKVLHNASKGRLGAECIKRVVESARTTLGMPMLRGEELRLRFTVEQIVRELRGIDAVDDAIAERVAKDQEMSRIAVVLGAACAASIASHVGSIGAFSGRALEKAIGINLKVKSSGNIDGNVHITKRGPAQVRQLLYLAVLRLVQTDPIVAAWYHARTSYTEKSRQKAIVAVMRKLARALGPVARGAVFDAAKLFDTRRLDIKRAENEVAAAREAAVRALALPHKEQRSQGGAPQQTA